MRMARTNDESFAKNRKSDAIFNGMDGHVQYKQTRSGGLTLFTSNKDAVMHMCVCVRVLLRCCYSDCERPNSDYQKWNLILTIDMCKTLCSNRKPEQHEQDAQVCKS